MIKSLKAYLDNFLQESSEDNISPQNKIELATAVLMIEISPVSYTHLTLPTKA